MHCIPDETYTPTIEFTHPEKKQGKESSKPAPSSGSEGSSNAKSANQNVSTNSPHLTVSLVFQASHSSLHQCCFGPIESFVFNIPLYCESVGLPLANKQEEDILQTQATEFWTKKANFARGNHFLMLRLSRVCYPDFLNVCAKKRRQKHIT